MDQIYYRRNAAGLIEGVDITTNEVVQLQHTMRETPESLVPIVRADGRTVYIESNLLVRGVSTESIMPTHEYSSLLADLLVQSIVEGASLKHACHDLNIDYSVVNRWKKQNTGFSERLEEAMRDRAEWQHDKILQISQESRDAKIAIDALKWSAGANNPEKFSPKTKISGDKDSPVHFILSTGIDRSTSPEEKEATASGGPALEEAPEKTLGEYDVVATNVEEACR